MERLSPKYPNISPTNSTFRGRAVAEVVGLSTLRSAFDPVLVDVGFMVDKVTFGQVSLRVLLFFSVSVITPVFDADILFIQHRLLTAEKTSLGVTLRSWNK